VIRRRLTYANVIATLAIFLALGGGAYAALRLPVGSVGTAQIKSNAVTLSKIAARARTALRGAAGARGATGPEGAPGASCLPTNPACIGPKGDTGQQGPAGPFPGTLPRGITLRGIYQIRYVAKAADEFYGDAISFGFRFASAPTANVVAPGAAPPAACVGGTVANPAAQPGNICFFSEFAANELGHLFAPTPTQFGERIEVKSAASGDTVDHGSWAATSP
jgi:hypothetical protein